MKRAHFNLMESNNNAALAVYSILALLSSFQEPNKTHFYALFFLHRDVSVTVYGA